MHSTTIPFQLQLPDQVPFAFSILALAERLQRLSDRRKRRGLRYPLPVLLTLAVLAKLAGQSRLEPMADWTRLRAAELARLFGLKRMTMPHQSTWSRVLGQALDVDQLEQVLGQFFRKQQQTAEVPPAGVSCWPSMAIPCAEPSQLGRPAVCIWSPPISQRLRVVLVQLAVDGKENEIVVVPQLLAQLDLTGIVVVGDAMQAQCELSIQVMDSGGDYL